MTYQVFISHGWHDRWIAARMADLLKKARIVPFIDMYDIQTGDIILQRILDGTSSSDELLCLITPFSVNRNWIWTEMGMMLSLGRRVTAVLYGITLDQIAADHGGAAHLNASLVADINSFSDYIKDVKKRARTKAET